MISTGPPVKIVSVIIPCYNHGRYLARAIESVLAQDYPHHEIIVIDDGSKDETAFVARRYEAVKYIYHHNQGLSAARNTGIKHCSGQFLVFLDADDWLFPEALSTNLYYLEQRPDVGFVSGAFTDVLNYYGNQVKHHREKDQYNYLLEQNYIAMHATVMYKRQVFDTLRYDTSLRACEDYDIYLKIARKYPVISHTRQIAVYNRHDSNMSGNYPMMLDQALLVLNRQREGLLNKSEEQFFYRGLQSWKDHYCINIYANLASNIETNAQKKRAQLDTLKLYHKDLYYKYLLTKPFMMIKKSLIKRNFNFLLKALNKAGLYKKFIPAPGKIAMGDFNRVTPLSTNFGYERGGPVDRYYIENFLQKQSKHIRGRVLEIGDNDYTLRFGECRVTQSDILHINSENNKATFIGDLSDAPVLPSNAFDCVVLTQTLQFIFEYRKALDTCYRILKPGGILLLTVPGISHIDQGEWKKIWMYSFTESLIIKALSALFPLEKIEVETFGNVLVASAFLYGMGLPELKKSQLDYNDPHYQVIITATATKPS